MHHKASKEIFRRAKMLRENMTPAEQVLWEKLRAGRLNGIKFRRQHPVSKYILDFYCHQYRLGIELNGEIHNHKDQKERDLGRGEDLEGMGIKIIRCSNTEVEADLGQVLYKILLITEKKIKVKVNTMQGNNASYL